MVTVDQGGANCFAHLVFFSTQCQICSKCEVVCGRTSHDLQAADNCYKARDELNMEFHPNYLVCVCVCVCMCVYMCVYWF